jgi:hypothetical protein
MRSSEAITRICVARADGIEMRGRDVCRELIGRLSFTDYFLLLLARAGGLLTHLAEEQQKPIGFALAAGAEEAVSYEKSGEGA